jgi:hypothetical protein
MLVALTEDSPLTIEGSFSKDLIISKMWLCREIAKAMETIKIDQFGTVAILGAWYGNMGLIAKIYGISFQKMIVNDINPAYLATSKRLLSSISSRVEILACDANAIDYSEMAGPLLVINTSCNDMHGSRWFDLIPKNSLVALQSRSDHESLSEMRNRLALGKELYVGAMDLTDPMENYSRFSLIGLK